MKTTKSLSMRKETCFMFSTSIIKIPTKIIWSALHGLLIISFCMRLMTQDLVVMTDWGMLITNGSKFNKIKLIARGHTLWSSTYPTDLLSWCVLSKTLKGLRFQKCHHCQADNRLKLNHKVCWKLNKTLSRRSINKWINLKIHSQWKPWSSQ